MELPQAGDLWPWVPGACVLCRGPGQLSPWGVEVGDTSVAWVEAVMLGSSDQSTSVQTGGVATGLLLAEEPAPGPRWLACWSQECTLPSCCHCHQEGVGTMLAGPQRGPGTLTMPGRDSSCQAPCTCPAGAQWGWGTPCLPSAPFLPGSPQLCRCQGPGAGVTVTKLPTGKQEP